MKTGLKEMKREYKKVDIDQIEVTNLTIRKDNLYCPLVPPRKH